MNKHDELMLDRALAEADALKEKGWKKYRKKPIVIMAIQVQGDFTVNTLEGLMKGKHGDYLIVGIEGERYPCKKEIFEKTYEVIE